MPSPLQRLPFCWNTAYRRDEPSLTLQVPPEPKQAHTILIVAHLYFWEMSGEISRFGDVSNYFTTSVSQTANIPKV